MSSKRCIESEDLNVKRSKQDESLSESELVKVCEDEEARGDESLFESEMVKMCQEAESELLENVANAEPKTRNPKLLKSKRKYFKTTETTSTSSPLIQIK